MYKRTLIVSCSRQALLVGLIAGAVSLTGGDARAQNSTIQLNQLEAQILQIQQQNAAEIAGLQQEIKQLKTAQQQPAAVSAQTAAAPSGQVVYAQPAATITTAAAAAAGSSPLNPKLIESPTHQFGLSSANGANTLAILARVQVDAGNYLTTRPEGGKIAGTGPGSVKGGPLDSGVNIRRARLGIGGTFQNDWAYRFLYDFGGSSDSLTTGVAGADTSGVENAYVTYNGFYGPKRRFPVAIDFGYLDTPWTLDYANSSNDIMFMERAAAVDVASQFGGGNFRSAFGARSNTRDYWAAAYFTGPTSGAPHTGATDPALAFLARASYQLIQNKAASLHFGADFSHVFQVRAPYIAACSTSAGYVCATTPSVVKTNSSYFVLSDQPELRTDPTAILNTGYIPTSNGDVLGGELAGAWGPFFAQGEYYHYIVDQIQGGVNPSDGAVDKRAPTLAFNGGYLEASYSIGGTRQYIPATGGYSGVVPTDPFDLRGGGWGALELAARYSDIDLNDDVKSGVAPHLTGGVAGGTQEIEELGLNWYPNVNMKFMLDFDHAQIDKLKATTNGTAPIAPAGTTVNAIAARAQFVY